MKKISILLALILCFMLFVSCGDTKAPEKTEAKETTATESTTEAETKTETSVEALEDTPSDKSKQLDVNYYSPLVNVESYAIHDGWHSVRVKYLHRSDQAPSSLTNQHFLFKTYDEYGDFYDNVMTSAYMKYDNFSPGMLPFSKSDYIKEFFDEEPSSNGFNKIGLYIWRGEEDAFGIGEAVLFPYKTTKEGKTLVIHAQRLEHYYTTDILRCSVPQVMILVELSGKYDDFELRIDSFDK